MAKHDQFSLHGEVKLQFVSGFELNDDIYSMSLNDAVVLYASKECSMLRVLQESKKAETQMEIEIARIECITYCIKDSPGEPRISVVIVPIAVPQIIQMQPITLPHQVKVGPVRRLEIYDRKNGHALSTGRIDIQPSELVTINMDGFPASFYVDFSGICGIDGAAQLPLHPVVPSSEGKDTEMDSRTATSPVLNTANISFVKETPSASRIWKPEELAENPKVPKISKLQVATDAVNGAEKNFTKEDLYGPADTDEEDLDTVNAPHTNADRPLSSGSVAKSFTGSSLQNRSSHTQPIERSYLDQRSNIHVAPEHKSHDEQDTPVNRISSRQAPLKGRKSKLNKKKRPADEDEDQQPKKRTRSQSLDMEKPQPPKKGRGRLRKSTEASVEKAASVDGTPTSHVSIDLPKPIAIAEQSKPSIAPVGGNVETDLQVLEKSVTRARGRPTNVATAKDEVTIQDEEETNTGNAEKAATKSQNRHKKTLPTTSAESNTGDGVQGNTVSPDRPTRSSQRGSEQKLVVSGSQCEFLTKCATKKLITTHMKVVDSMSESVNVLVVGNSLLKATSKQLKAILLGKPIISDLWLKESLRKNKLLPYTDFFASDQEGEAHWSAAKAWSSGEMKRIEHDFSSTILYITPSLQRRWGTENFAEMKEIGTLLGFKSVTTYPAASTKAKSSTILALGLENGDLDVKILQERDFIHVYNKDLLAAAIFRGCLVEDEEFRLPLVSEEHNAGAPTAKAGRKKKQV